MTTKVTVKGPTPNAGRILVQQVDPTQTNRQASSSPIEVPEGEERDFWIHQTNAVLVTELPGSAKQSSAPDVVNTERPSRRR